MQSENLKDIETILLETLSFYDEMSLEDIILQMSSADINHNKKLTGDDLLKALESLTKRRKIKLSAKKPDKKWIRIFPKRSGPVQKILKKFQDLLD